MPPRANTSRHRGRHRTLALFPLGLRGPELACYLRPGTVGNRGCLPSGLRGRGRPLRIGRRGRGARGLTQSGPRGLPSTRGIERRGPRPPWRRAGVPAGHQGWPSRCRPRSPPGSAWSWPGSRAPSISWMVRTLTPLRSILVAKVWRSSCAVPSTPTLASTSAASQLMRLRLICWPVLVRDDPDRRGAVCARAMPSAPRLACVCRRACGAWSPCRGAAPRPIRLPWPRRARPSAGCRPPRDVGPGRTQQEGHSPGASVVVAQGALAVGLVQGTGLGHGLWGRVRPPWVRRLVLLPAQR
jgi:hypothetical protein